MPIDVFINGTKVGEYIGEPIVEGPDYCSIEQVKERALLSLDDSTHDEQIDTCIQEASRFIDDKIRKYVAAVPLTTVPDSIVAAAADLACALFQRRHLPEQYNAAWWTSGLDKLQTYIEGLKHQGYFYVGEGTAEPDIEEAETDAAKESTLTAMKGSGWTVETLKAIKDAIDAMGGGAGTATIEKQNQALDGTTNLSGGWDAATDNLHDVSDQIAAIPTTPMLAANGALEATLTAIKGAGWSTETLKVIKDIVAAIPTTAMRGTDNALLAANYVTERGTDNAALASVCTEARLAELAAANLPTDVDAIKARVTNHLITRTWFSEPQALVTLTASAGDKTLPSVVLPDIAGTIVSVKAGWFFGTRDNTNATANQLAGDQEIQVKENAAGSFIDAIKMKDNQFATPASTTGMSGVPVFGTIDVVAQVAAFNKTYDFQWDEGVADLANLVFNDVQTFLIVSYY